jgi:flagellar hook-associated protein 3 FlgL
MRITDYTVATNIVGQIQQLSSQQAKLQTQVSTGQRIFQPEDDPAAVGRVLNLQTEQRDIAQFQNNAARALQISQATYSGLQSVKTVSDRASQIGTLGTGDLNSSQYQAYATEVNQLIEQTLQAANSKNGNDYLFAGTAVDTAPYVAARDAQGNVTGITYAGNTSQLSVPISQNSSIAPNSSGATNTNLRDFLNQLVSLRDALNAGDSAAVTTAQTGLNSSEDHLVSALAETGGIQARIQANQTEQTNRATDIQKLVSDETSADLPSTIVKLQQTQTAYQAALQSAVNIMHTSLLDYLK